MKPKKLFARNRCSQLRRVVHIKPLGVSQFKIFLQNFRLNAMQLLHIGGTISHCKYLCTFHNFPSRTLDTLIILQKITFVSSSLEISRAQLDWAYEFPDRTGLDTQICRTGPAGPDWIRTYIFKHFTYQVWFIDSL